MKSCVYHKGIFLLAVAVLLLNSCNQKQPVDKRPVMSEQETEEMLLRVNKFLVDKDLELMHSYAQQKEWNMEVSETGLFYEIFEKTDNNKVEQGDLISIDYKVSLLDGSVCYSSDKDGPREFRLGKSQEISGLEQGIALMREGEKARFIIPPHLAYGLIGDEERIPARAIIVYMVELSEIK